MALRALHAMLLVRGLRVSQFGSRSVLIKRRMAVREPPASGAYGSTRATIRVNLSLEDR